MLIGYGQPIERNSMLSSNSFLRRCSNNSPGLSASNEQIIRFAFFYKSFFLADRSERNTCRISSCSFQGQMWGLTLCSCCIDWKRQKRLHFRITARVVARMDALTWLAILINSIYVRFRCTTERVFHFERNGRHETPLKPPSQKPKQTKNHLWLLSDYICWTPQWAENIRALFAGCRCGSNLTSTAIKRTAATANVFLNTILSALLHRSNVESRMATMFRAAIFHCHRWIETLRSSQRWCIGIFCGHSAQLYAWECDIASNATKTRRSLLNIDNR